MQIIGLQYISYSLNAGRKCVKLEAKMANITQNCCQAISCVSDGLETSGL